MTEKEVVSFVSEQTEARPSERRARRPKQGRKWTPQAIFGLILALIPLIGFLIFSGFPLIISFIALFCDVDIYHLGGFAWNSFEGFKVIFLPEYSLPTYGLNIASYFYKAVGITFWLASVQLVTLLVALGIATLLATRPRGQKVFYILYFVPYICSSVAVALMWRWFFNGETSGVLNTLLGTDIRWLENTSTITWTIVVAIMWQAPGYGIVMYKAAFANVDTALYEAASLDGANGWHKFWYVTLPAVAPTTFFLLISGVTAGFLTYDIAALMIPDGWTGNIGGNGSMGLTLMRLSYWLITNDQLTESTVSASAVVSWVLFVLTASISWVLFKRREKSMEE